MYKFFFLTIIALFSIQGPVLAQNEAVVTKLNEEISINQVADESLEGPNKKLIHRIYQFAKDNFYSLVNNINEVPIDTADLGLDNLIVANVSMSLYRTIEVNPNSKDKTDKFLVSDYMKIGFRLGGGLVLMGDIGLFKSYTLVRTASSHQEALLKDDFIVNLLLPYKVIKNKLPKNYVLMKESFLEGRGRLKLLVPKMPVLSETSVSRVNLKRMIVDQRKDDAFNVITDTGKYTEFAQTIDLTYSIFSFNIFNLSNQKGKIRRKIYRVNQTDEISKLDKKKIVVSGETDQLEDISDITYVDDEFSHKQLRFNAFYLIDNEFRGRYDKITEFKLEDNYVLRVTNEQHQYSSSREYSWFLGFSGELFREEVLFVTKEEDKEFKNPYMILNWQIEDKRTSEKELFSKYINSINQISFENHFQNIPEIKSLHTKPKVRLNSSMVIPTEAFHKLINLDKEDLWDQWARLTKISKREWKKLSRPKNQRESITYSSDLRSMAKRINYFIRGVNKLKKFKTMKKKVTYLSNLMRKAMYRNSGRFEPYVLSLIFSITNDFGATIHSDLYIHDLDDNGEINLISLKADTGEKFENPHQYYRFFFEKPTDLYYLFDQN